MHITKLNQEGAREEVAGSPPGSLRVRGYGERRCPVTASSWQAARPATCGREVLAVGVICPPSSLRL